MDPTYESVEALMKEVPASSIPLKPDAPAKPKRADPFAESEDFWIQQSKEAFHKYVVGKQICGISQKDSVSLEAFLKKLDLALREILKQEYLSNTMSSDKMSLHFSMLSNILSLIAQDMDYKALKTSTGLTFAAALYGFLEVYIKQQTLKD